VEAAEAFTEDACYVPLFRHLLLFVVYCSDVFFVLIVIAICRIIVAISVPACCLLYLLTDSVVERFVGG